MIVHASSKGTELPKLFTLHVLTVRTRFPPHASYSPLPATRNQFSLFKSLRLGWNKRPMQFWHHLKAERRKPHGCLTGRIRAPTPGFAVGHQLQQQCLPSTSTHGVQLRLQHKMHREQRCDVPRWEESKRNRRAERRDPEPSPLCSLPARPRLGDPLRCSTPKLIR